MKTRLDIGGSYVVVQLSADWEHYIDARKLVDLNALRCVISPFTRIEVVHAGQVRRHYIEHNQDAPEKIMQLVKEELK